MFHIFGIIEEKHATKLMMSTLFTVGRNLHERNAANGARQDAIATIFGVLPLTETVTARVCGSMKNVIAIKPNI